MYFFRLNGVKFSFADVLFITSVLTICMIILVVTVCFCVTSTTTNHVRYISSPFFLNFQNLVSHILADSDWQISIFQKNISEREPIISDDIISRKLKTLHDKLGKDTIQCMYFIIIIFLQLLIYLTS